MNLTLDAISWLTGPLAQLSNWSRMGDRFSGKHLTLQPEDVIGAVLLICAGVLGFWLLQYLAARQATADTRKCPKRLFAELSAAHRLSRPQRRACRAVATAKGLQEKGELFVRTDLADAVAAEDRELARRLFDGA